MSRSVKNLSPCPPASRSTSRQAASPSKARWASSSATLARRSPSAFDDGQEQSSCTRDDDSAPGPRLARPDAGADQQHGRSASPRATRRSSRSSGVGYLARDPGRTCCSCASALPTKCTRRFPTGLTVTCPDQTHIVIKGTDKQLVGQFAAEVRAVRKPEPYKGKGIRYEGEAGPPQGRQGHDEVTVERRVSSVRRLPTLSINDSSTVEPVEHHEKAIADSASGGAFRVRKRDARQRRRGRG